MKKIWIINHYAKPDGERHYNIGKKLSQRGYSVRIVCASTSLLEKNSLNSIREVEEKKVDNINFNIVPAKEYYGNGKDRIINILQFSFRAYKYLRKEKERPDIIYASSVHPLNWVIGYFLSKKFKSKLVIETRDLWPETLVRMGVIKINSLIAKGLYQLEKYIYKKADHLIFTMPGGEKYLKEHNIKYKNVTNINNGVNINEFNTNAERYIYKINKTINSFNVVYTGSMGKANALDVLLESANKIKGERNIYFHLFGDGYEKKRLELFAKNHNLDNVIFYGKVDKKYIPSILKQADLNIVTSLNLSIYKYGVSLNKLFDYFAAAKPIISNIPTPFNKVEKYGTGVTVKPESPIALAQAIMLMNTIDNESYAKFCVNAKKTALLFDYENLVDQLEEVFNK